MRQLFLGACLACLAGASLAGEEMTIPAPDGPLGAGAILVPEASAAVVIVPGTGPRDGNAPALGLNSDAYRLLAEALAGQGLSAIRIDKRGFFSSAQAIADPDDVTIGAYAQDLRGWIDHAATLAPCVWVIGHSEGGLVALLAGARDPAPLCGLILLTAPGRPIGRLLVEQMRRNPMAAPLLPEIEAIVAGLEAGRTRDPASIPFALRPLFSEGVQSFMLDAFSHDPADYAARVTVPVLVVHAGADVQVFAEDAALLMEALPQGTRLDLPDMTHMLKTDQPGAPHLSYLDPSQPLHPDLAGAIARFVAQHPPG